MSHAGVRRWLSVLVAAVGMMVAAGPGAAQGGRRVEVRGVVSSINGAAASFVLQARRPVTVYTTADTQFRNNDGTPATFASLDLGGPVLVRGRQAADGAVTAAQVVITVVRRARVGGVVTAVSGTQFVVQRAIRVQLTVETGPDTTFQKNDGTPGSLGDVQPGVSVAVRGIQSAPDRILATEVLILVVRRVEIAGTVESVGVGTFVLERPGGLDVAVVADGSTLFRRNDGTPGTFTDLAPGVDVEVEGIQNPDQTVQAREVLILVIHPVQLEGVVTQIDPPAGSFRVRRSTGIEVDVTTDDHTRFRRNDGTAANFASLALGANVVARGIETAPNTLAAHRVVILVVGRVLVDGMVVAVDPAALRFSIRQLSGLELEVQADAQTWFRKNNGAAATFADLAVGQAVEVEGRANPDGSLAALRVLIVVRRTVTVRGHVESVNAADGSFLLQPGVGPDLVIRTGAATRFAKNDGSPAAFGDLFPGQDVRVAGHQNADNSLDAGRVLLIVVEILRREGVIVSLDAGTASFTIQHGVGLQTVVRTGAETQFLKNDGTGATFADLAVGLMVRVEGPQNGDGSLAGDQVLLLIARRVSVAGVVVVRGDAGFILHPARGPDLEVLVDAETTYRKSDGSAATFSDVAPGAPVRVRGTQNADGTIAASQVVIVVR